MSAAALSIKIGLWMGGSFSPPTLAHIKAMKMAAEALADLNKEAVIYAYFVPVNEKYNKPSVKPECISSAHRLAMLELVVKHLQSTVGSKKIVYGISKNETSADDAVKTVDSAKMVRDANGLSKLYVALGEDNLIAVLQGKWSRGDELLGENGILWFPRGGVSANVNMTSIAGVKPELFELFLAGGPVRVNIDATAISSTVLRKAIRNTRAVGTKPDLSTLTLPEIAEYISENAIMYGPECESASAGGRRRHTRRRRHVKKTRRHCRQKN